MPKVERVLISVYDKSGIVEFAREMRQRDVEIISTGGTARHLNEHGIPTAALSDVTGFPEILQGRVKTLHPRIFGGLLSLRQNAGHMREIREHGIATIDMVVVNLYPFEKTVAKPDVPLEEALENIDIGGPSMIRAAAKNFTSVAVVTSPEQYGQVLQDFKKNRGEISMALRQDLAREAFRRTSAYDAAIHAYFESLKGGESDFPDRWCLNLAKVQDLRYGENPHQRAAMYGLETGRGRGLVNAEQLHGKELSYNNILDLDAAIGMASEFDEPCVVIVKHTNPCGVGVAGSLAEAYPKAKATDPVSSFGGIVGCNRIVDVETARAITEIFTEVVVAPDYAPEALEQLKSKKNLRIIKFPEIFEAPAKTTEFKYVQGCVLLQDKDHYALDDIKFKVVSKRSPDDDEWAALKFGWRVAQWVKSNAIVYCKADRTIGIGAGQMSRVDSSKIAVEKARRMGLELQGTAMASDAFFPFRDGIDEAARAGATCVIQPGGSIRDAEVIAAADEQNMAMVFTGIRHFRH